MKRLLLALLLASVSTVAAKDITVAEARELVEAKAVTVLDIRTPEEFAAGHIEGARSIDFFDPKFEERVAALDREKRYLVHCKSGGRSGKALAIFSKLGFTNLLHLKTGYDGWKTTAATP